MTTNSYRSLLRSSYLIGGAQAIFILAGLIKMKVAAVLLGPAGIGLVGLYLNLMQASSTAASLGLNHAGTKQIALACGAEDWVAIELTRKTLSTATTLLALLAGLVIWLTRDQLAIVLLGDVRYAQSMGWLCVGVMLLVATTAQNARLTGLRRVSDLAKINVKTGIGAMVVSVLAISVFGQKAIILFVLATPALAFALNHFYVVRLPRRQLVYSVTWQQIRQHFMRLLQIGGPFMLAGLVALVGPLVVRTLVQRELGLDAAGQFQAAWSISLTYMGLVLGVMVSDFHPRLVAMISDRAAAIQLVNEQLDVTVSLCAPVLLLLLGLAPWVIHLLYSAEFTAAIDILRWQLLGDALKVICFPLGFVLLAAGASKRYLLLEILGMSIFVLVAWQMLPIWGVTATGLAFLLMYVFYLPIVLHWVMQSIDFHMSFGLVKRIVLLLASAVLVSVASQYSVSLAAGLSVVCAAGFSVRAFVRIRGYLTR